VKTRVVAITLIVVGVTATIIGFGSGRWFFTEDLGHHDGRTRTFALQSTVGADTLSVVPLGEAEVQISVLRAGQPILAYDDVHGNAADVLAVSSDLTRFVHQELADIDGTGVGTVGLPGGGEYRVVAQTAPAGGPDLLELAVTVSVPGDPAGDGTAVAGGDVWTDDDLSVTRQGFDFVLSEPWDGETFRGAPAMLSLFRADDLAFTHAHATTPDDDRVRVAVDLPGPGDYLAALEFEQGDEHVTALFRITV
jgi:hypothetical protein